MMSSTDPASTDAASSSESSGKKRRRPGSTATMTAALSREEMVETLTCPTTFALFYAPVLINCASNTDEASKKKHVFEQESAQMAQANGSCCPSCRAPFTSYVAYEPYQKLLTVLLNTYPDLKAEQYQPGKMKIETIDEKAVAQHAAKAQLIAAGFTEQDMVTQDAAFSSPDVQAMLWRQFARPQQPATVNAASSNRFMPPMHRARHSHSSLAPRHQPNLGRRQQPIVIDDAEEFPEDGGFNPDDIQRAIEQSIRKPT